MQERARRDFLGFTATVVAAPAIGLPRSAPILPRRPDVDLDTPEQYHDAGTLHVITKAGGLLATIPMLWTMQGPPGGEPQGRPMWVRGAAPAFRAGIIVAGYWQSPYAPDDHLERILATDADVVIVPMGEVKVDDIVYFSFWRAISEFPMTSRDFDVRYAVAIGVDPSDPSAQ